MKVNRIELSNVIMEHPRVFRPILDTHPLKDTVKPKYVATFSFSKYDIDNVDIVEAACIDFDRKLKPLIKDGDNSGLDIFANKFIIRGDSLKLPLILDKNGGFVLDQVDEFYNGIHVNVVLDVWENHSDYFNCICATIVAIRLLTDR